MSCAPGPAAARLTELPAALLRVRLFITDEQVEPPRASTQPAPSAPRRISLPALSRTCGCVVGVGWQELLGRVGYGLATLEAVVSVLHPEALACAYPEAAPDGACGPRRRQTESR